MPVCQSCGSDQPQENNFCANCGSDLREASERTQAFAPISTEEPVEGLGELSFQPDEHPSVLIKRGTQEPELFRLPSGETITIGRDPSSSLFLDDITISRKHAALTYNGKVSIIKDLGSTNGTYVNRDLIDEKVLHNGDEVQIGKYVLAFLVKE